MNIATGTLTPHLEMPSFTGLSRHELLDKLASTVNRAWLLIGAASDALFDARSADDGELTDRAATLIDVGRESILAAGNMIEAGYDRLASRGVSASLNSKRSNIARRGAFDAALAAYERAEAAPADPNDPDAIFAAAADAFQIMIETASPDFEALLQKFEISQATGAFGTSFVLPALMNDLKALAAQTAVAAQAEGQVVEDMLGEVRAKRPCQARRPKHMLSGLAWCGTCGGAWTSRGVNRWGCSRNKEGGPGACANGRTISTPLMEARVLSGLQEQLLDPELVDVFVREYHLDFARRAKELIKENDRLRHRHGEAAAKVERLVRVIAEGGGEFQEIRDVLTTARTDRDNLAAELAQLEQLPVVALHPTIARDYRAQVEKLNAALSENPATRLEAIPRLRALIDRVIISPAEDARGVAIALTGRLPAMLALATGKPVVPHVWGNDGAGEGIRTLDPNLGKVVLYP